MGSEIKKEANQPTSIVYRDIYLYCNSQQITQMKMLTYKDPLLEPHKIANKKFGEIFCDTEGSFIYRCDFCAVNTNCINDVERHLLTHFKDVFQPKNDILATEIVEYNSVERCANASTKEVSRDETLEDRPSNWENDCSNKIEHFLECDTCGWNARHRDELKKHLRTHQNTTVEVKKSKFHRSKELEKKIEGTTTLEPSLKHQSDEQTIYVRQKTKRKKSTKPVIHCRLCDKEFHCQTYLAKHIENHSFYPAIFECDICGKRVKERKDFIEHMNRAHIGIKYPCKVCGKKFAQSSYVLIHMRMHNQDRGHQCAVCGKTFFTSGALTSHMRKHNNTLNVLPCNICGKIFHLPGALRDHLRVHSGEKPFKCDLCSTWFRTKKFLNQHKFVHLDVKQFACEICGMKFKQASGKRVHKRKVHGKLVGTDKRCKNYFDEVIT